MALSVLFLHGRSPSVCSAGLQVAGDPTQHVLFVSFSVLTSGSTDRSTVVYADTHTKGPSACLFSKS